MSLYELDYRFSVLGKSVKTLGAAVEPGSSITYTFSQKHLKTTRGDVGKRHELYARASSRVPDTVLISHTLGFGHVCIDCSEQCGFKSEADINAMAGLNGRLRWVPTKNWLAQFFARARFYVR